jgi:hypothetical protein
MAFIGKSLLGPLSALSFQRFSVLLNIIALALRARPW